MSERVATSNAEQSDYWNGDAGNHWVQQADGLDFMLQGIGEQLLARTSPQSGHRALDVGCGSGAVTLALQDRIGNEGRAYGVDISRALILEAQRRATATHSKARFIEADASTWCDESKFDLIVSRFGVMFFDDPVAAFANLLKLCRAGGHLHFVCWCHPKESDFATGLLKAVSALITVPEKPTDASAPGPYAFADSSRVASILTEAGWSDVKFERSQARLPVPGATVRESAEFVLGIGVIGRLMREQRVAMEQVVDAIFPFLEERKVNERITLQSPAWIVSARKGNSTR